MMLKDIMNRLPISGNNTVKVIDPEILLGILDKGLDNEPVKPVIDEEIKSIIQKIIDILTRFLKLLFPIFFPFILSAQSEHIQTSGIVGDGLGVLDKVLGMWEQDNCDEIRVVKARKKGVGYVNKLTRQLQKLDKQWAKNEIDDLTYYYSKAYLLEMSIADVVALEKKAVQLARTKVKNYKVLKNN